MAFMFPVRGYTHNIIICVDIQHVRQHVKLILIGFSLYLAHWEYYNTLAQGANANGLIGL